MSRTRLIVGGSLIYVGAVALGYQYMTGKNKKDSPGSEGGSPQEITASYRIAIFDKISKDYDRKLWFDENFFLINFYRWRLLSLAKGDILEVAAGTGRNIPSYWYHSRAAAGGITSLTMVDKSSGMMAQAREKWDRIVSGKWESLLVGISDWFYAAPKTPLRVTFLELDAGEVSSRFGENAFDTVVDTFGLCSFEDPVKVLQELRKTCKPNGKIILLEHGVGDYGLMKDYQEKALGKHVATWGCYFNRDIKGIVEQAGLKMELIQRHHFGTTYCIVASPNKQPVK